MKKSAALFIAVLVALAAFPVSAQQQPAAGDSNLRMFSMRASAHQHCPSDKIVWLDTKSGIFYNKGEAWYGNTQSGGYMCEKEAYARGKRPASHEDSKPGDVVKHDDAKPKN